ncbi:MAG: hypothetical protein PHE17_18260 [Thiothrix sp.]|uniref:hypothetical protein n=1 Tax=Thiothrix sp. TaxID=1032 RepID=UPI002619A8BE|nr:hypothetical protein [Thiothrix sp.]MDD5394966.1 hypothetical protein [Thiothrix sp.]
MKSLLFVMLPSLLVAGCATVFEKAAPPPQGINVDGASNVVFEQVHIENTAKGTGNIKGNLYRAGAKPIKSGHIDYKVTDQQGRMLDEGQTQISTLTPFLLGRHIKPRKPAHFIIHLKQPWQPGLHRISIIWHDKPHQL